MVGVPCRRTLARRLGAGWLQRVGAPLVRVSLRCASVVSLLLDVLRRARGALVFCSVAPLLAAPAGSDPFGAEVLAEPAGLAPFGA